MTIMSHQKAFSFNQYPVIYQQDHDTFINQCSCTLLSDSIFSVCALYSRQQRREVEGGREWLTSPENDNILMPRQNSRQFAGDNLKCIFLNFFLLIQISLEFLLNDPIIFSFSSDTGLVTNRRQGNVCTNDAYIHWRVTRHQFALKGKLTIADTSYQTLVIKHCCTAHYKHHFNYNFSRQL